MQSSRLALLGRLDRGWFTCYVDLDLFATQRALASALVSLKGLCVLKQAGLNRVHPPKRT